MARNVEIKARTPDLEAAAAVARRLSGGEAELLHQEDVFLYAPSGRLKLRIFAENQGELIYYKRADRAGPKTSQYEIFPTDRPHELRALLTAALGVRAVVRKTRQVYLSGRTRIHLDRVDGLGDFIELEVVLSEDEDPADGEREARELMAELGVGPDDLIERAYVDLLEDSS
jgi:predicted adenylyl cyclase CyaB